MLQPVLINRFKFLKATHRTKIRKIEIPRSMAVEGLELLKQQYNVGVKPIILLYTYTNHHEGTPKQRQKHTRNLDITQV